MFTGHVYYFENIKAFDKILLSKEIKKNNGQITHFAKDPKLTHIIVENTPATVSEKVCVSVGDFKRQLAESTMESAPESIETAAVFETEVIEEVELHLEAEQRLTKEERKIQKKIQAEKQKQQMKLQKKAQIQQKRHENAEREAQKSQAIIDEKQRIKREAIARKQEIKRLKDEATWVTPNKTFVQALLAAPVPVNTLELGRKLFVGKMKLDDLNNPTTIALRKSSMEYIFLTFGPAIFRHHWERNYFFVIYDKKEDAEKAFSSLSVYENRVKLVDRFKHDNISAPKPNFYVRWPQA